MGQAKQGDTVKVHYTGRLCDDTVFDTSEGREPLEFTIGQQQVIAGFEQAVIGMDLGESRTSEIPADRAYGPRDEKLVMEVSRQRVPDDLELRVDDRLQVRRADGETLVVTVTDLSDTNVTLDGNHPLAGQDLVFDIRLVEIA
jgi:FKBP-type peptidyl-prolyl cis-trans isomerase 2